MNHFSLLIFVYYVINVTILFQELEKLLDVLKHSHELLSRDLSVDSFSLMLNEMQENISLVSFSSRLASQVCPFEHKRCTLILMSLFSKY